jgi:hypothetical protein
MTLRTLYLVVALALGVLFALTKVAVAPSDIVGRQCQSIKQPNELDRRMCDAYGHPLK